MFDGSAAASRRRLRLMGWIPVTEDPLKIGSRQHRIAVPWIDGRTWRSLAGFLVASSISKLEMQGAIGNDADLFGIVGRVAGRLHHEIA